MNMEEIWKDIQGYEGLYQVSNLGKIKSLNRISCINRQLTGKILNPIKQISGYYSIGLSKNAEVKLFLIHRLVAEAFIPNPNNYPCVNHKDENKQNNFVWVNKDGTVDLEKSNLEWCTVKYNSNYGTRNKRLSDNHKGILNTHKSKSILQFDLKNNYIKEYPSVAEVNRQLGYGISTICNCCKGKYKQAYGYIWKYK